MQRSSGLYLGAGVSPTGGDAAPLHVPPHHLVTHGVVLGMTGSGKTGLVMVAVEEALRARVPVIMIDVKGDLPNLLLAFPSFQAREFAPWVEGHAPPDAPPNDNLAQQLADERRTELGKWNTATCEHSSSPPAGSWCATSTPPQTRPCSSPAGRCPSCAAR